MHTHELIGYVLIALAIFAHGWISRINTAPPDRLNTFGWGVVILTFIVLIVAAVLYFLRPLLGS